MSRIRTILSIAVAASLSACMLSACAHNRSTQTHKPAQEAAELTPAQRMSNLQASIAALDQTIAHLPAYDPARDRQLTAQALGQTAAALSALEGPHPSGAFRQQLRIVQTSRTQIDRASADVPIEPATDSALRAAYHALESLRDGRFAGDEQVAKLISAVGERIPNLDAVRGPLHSDEVSEVLRRISKALGAMASSVQSQLATPAPAQAPAPSPSPAH